MLRCPNHGTGDVVATTHSIRVALFLVVVVLVSSCAIVVMVTIPCDYMWEYSTYSVISVFLLSPVLKVDSGVMSDRDVNITANLNSSHPDEQYTVYAVANGSSFSPEQDDLLQARLTVSESYVSCLVTLSRLCSP